MLRLGDGRMKGITRKPGPHDVGHDPLAAPDLDELTGFRYQRQRQFATSGPWRKGPQHESDSGMELGSGVYLGAMLEGLFPGTASPGPLRKGTPQAVPKTVLVSVDLTLPHNQNLVAKRMQSALGTQVTRAIGPELVQPEPAVAPWRRRTAAPWMTMPEATVDEDDPLPFAVCDVRRPREIAVPNSISMT